MPEIRNTTNSDVSLPTGHVIPAGQAVNLTDAVMGRVENAPILEAKLRRGDLVSGPVPAPEPVAPSKITRTDIALMRKADLADLLAGAGETVHLNATADELRERAVEVFIDG